jgi:hypothetical protein
VDQTSLDTALDDSIRAVRRLRLGSLWPLRKAESAWRTFRNS